jgi:hypothetical protein
VNVSSNKTPILLASEKLKNLKITKVDADNTGSFINEESAGGRPESRNGGGNSRKGNRARKTTGIANLQPSPSEVHLQNMASIGSKGIASSSTITGSGGAFNINLTSSHSGPHQSHSQDPRPANMLPLMQGALPINSSESNKSDVNSNYGIGTNVNKLQKSSQNQSLFTVGTQSAKNLSVLPGSNPVNKQTAIATMSKHITTVPKLLADGNFKINITSG